MHVQEVVATYVDTDEGIVSLQEGERCQVLWEVLWSWGVRGVVAAT